MLSKNDKTNTTTNNTKTTSNKNDDTWLDHCLDYLRDHRLHPVVEVIASWQVAFSCIVYYGYSYFHALSQTKIRSTLVPLTTEPRRRRRRRVGDEDNNDDDDESMSWNDTILQELCQLSTEQLIAKVRSDISLRRRVSNFMTQTAITTAMSSTTSTPSSLSSSVVNKNGCATNGTTSTTATDAILPTIKTRIQHFHWRLETIWPKLLEFPPLLLQLENENTAESIRTFDISLIIPAYQEATKRIVWTLNKALHHCGNDPKRIQVIIVHVVESRNDNKDHNSNDNDNCALSQLLLSSRHYNELDAHSSTTTSTKSWGDVIFVPYTGGGGRGPAQNYGATFARGTLLTFLHADTLIPRHWDQKVQETLVGRPTKTNQPSQSQRIVQACAFSFGHYTKQLDGLPYPWGIRAVWLLGNLRAYLFRLPYGDHIISMPTTYFQYIGGFPDQCIMEDYDLMDLLRKRATVLPMEGIRIIGGPFNTAQCSVRRWQRFGTVYVTLVNALLVHRYSQGGWTADDVYEYYYERPVNRAKETKLNV